MISDVKKKLLKLVTQFRTLAFKGLNIILVFIVAKVYVSNIGAEDYGRYILLHGYLLTISTLIATGHGLYVFRSLVETKRLRITSVLEGAIFVLISYFGLLLLWLVIAPFVQFEEGNKTIVAVSFFGYAFTAFNVEVLRLWVRGDGYMLFKDTVRALMVLVVVVFAPFFTPEKVLLGSSLGSVSVSTLYILLLINKNKSEMDFEKIKWNKLHIDAWQGATIGLGSGLQILKSWLEIFVSGVLFSEAIVGMYSLFQKLAKLVNLPLVALNADIAKSLAAFTKGTPLSNATRTRIKYARIFASLFAAGALLITPVYIHFYDFELNWISALTCSVLIFSNLINVYFGPIGLVSQLAHLRKQYIVANLIAIVIIGLAAVLIVPSLGILSLAITSLVSAVFWNVMLQYAVYRHYNYRF
ncbi:MAG TPA: hypothetical protein DCR04_12860 [Flavobacteriales bacterium]|nr:hypothetical protein [Flavobacteriales bacterium]